MKQGHTLDFEEERVRDFVLELLTAQDRRLGRSEDLDMAVPDRGDVLVLMKSMRRTRSESRTLSGMLRSFRVNWTR